MHSIVPSLPSMQVHHRIWSLQFLTARGKLGHLLQVPGRSWHVSVFQFLRKSVSKCSTLRTQSSRLVHDSPWSQCQQPLGTHVLPSRVRYSPSTLTGSQLLRRRHYKHSTRSMLPMSSPLSQLQQRSNRSSSPSHNHISDHRNSRCSSHSHPLRSSCNQTCQQPRLGQA